MAPALPEDTMTTCHIASLPAELVEMIFSFLPTSPAPLPPRWLTRAPDYPVHPASVQQSGVSKHRSASRKRISGHKTIFIISAVCRRWRIIALSRTSAYGIPLPFKDPAPTAYVIASMSPLPIDLFINEEQCYGDASLQAAVETTLRYAGRRIRSIHVLLRRSEPPLWTRRGTHSPLATPPDAFDPCALLASCSAPALEEFRVYSYTQSGRCHQPLRRVTIPPDARSSLRIIELNGCELANAELFSSSTIVHAPVPFLTLQPSHIEALSLFSRLEVLSITSEASHAPLLHRTESKWVKVDLPRLTHLHLGGSLADVVFILRRITFPADASISLRADVFRSRPTESDHDISSLTALLAAHFARTAAARTDISEPSESASIVVGLCPSAFCIRVLGAKPASELFLSRFAGGAARDAALAAVCAALPLRAGNSEVGIKVEVLDTADADGKGAEAAARTIRRAAEVS